MSKPIPKSHGTPYVAPKPSKSSPMTNKTTRSPVRGAKPSGDGPTPAPIARSKKSSIASALLDRAQQENPLTAGGSMHPTNSSVRAPEDSANTDARQLGLSGSTEEAPRPTKRASGKSSPRPPKTDRR